MDDQWKQFTDDKDQQYFTGEYAFNLIITMIGNILEVNTHLLTK